MSIHIIYRHHCNFCGKSEDEVEYLLANTRGDSHICNECVEASLAARKQFKKRIIAQKPPETQE